MTHTSGSGGPGRVTAGALIVGCMLLLAACAAPAVSSSLAPPSAPSPRVQEPTPGASHPVPSTTPSERAGASPDPIAAPSARPVSTLAGHGLTQVIVDELIVRSAPGTGDESEIYTGVVLEGTRLWLYDGPVIANGYSWYHVVPEHPPLLSSGDPETPVLDGWVASGSRDGEPWLQGVDPECPGTVSLSTLAELSSAERFMCFGGKSLPLEAWIAPVYGSGGCGGSEPGWLTCFLEQLLLVSVEPPLAAITDPNGAPNWDADAAYYAVMFAPGVSRPMSAEGRYVRAVGHFDDPAAWGCGMPAFDDPEGIVVAPNMVYACRGQYVVESITVSEQRP